MGKRVCLVLLTMTLCVGGDCDVACTGDPWIPGGGVELDRTDCTMTIMQSDGVGEATVSAVITSSIGLPVELGEAQAVSVNGQELLAGGSAGTYGRTVAVAGEYTVTVSEPTRGVETTTIAAPGAIDATSPADGGAASLSGFTLTWSNADPNQRMRITLTQTLFGEERSKAFGPVMDTGSMVFSAADLASFQQGANLAVALTRINERAVINGFNTGTLAVERSRALLLTPGP